MQLFNTVWDETSKGRNFHGTNLQWDETSRLETAMGQNLHKPSNLCELHKIPNSGTFSLPW